MSEPVRRNAVTLGAGTVRCGGRVMAVIRRLMPEDDLAGLVALSRSFFEEYSALHAEFFRIDALWDEDIVSYFRGSVEADDGATFIALEDGAIVGYITVFVRSREPFWAVKTIGAISGLMVHKGNYSALLMR